MKRKIVAFSFITVLTLGMGLSSLVYGTSTYRNLLNTAYPVATNPGNIGCNTCHPGGDTGSLTSYGDRFLTAGANAAALQAIGSPGGAADTTAPVVSGFTVPATSSSLTVSGISITATDAVGVTGYRVTETNAPPVATATGWTATAPTSYTFATASAKTLYAWARDLAGNVSASRSASVTITLPDATAPVVSGFTVPATSSSLTVSGISITATDAVGVTGYRVTETNAPPVATATGWTATAPTSYTFATAGAKTLYAWARDLAGNVSASRSASVTITLPDATAPVVSGFTIPATSSSLTVSGISISATDAVGVTGYAITESTTAPTAWSASAPTGYTFATAGAKTLYAWARDLAGNVSASRPASVTITLPDATAPVVSGFTVPATSSSLTVSGISITATDAVGVTGYAITESTTAPTAWSASAPTGYTFATAGAKTLYAWARDLAGNVSASRPASVSITLPPAADTTRPEVTSFSIPAASASLTVPITSLVATDNVSVAGVMVTESATPPAATATAWGASAPATYTFASASVHTLYAWAKDGANNVSASRSASVTITLPPAPDTTRPEVTSFSIPATSTSLTVPITSLVATDVGRGVTGYLVTETATAPAAGWSATSPASYTLASAGVKVLYAWAIDAAGNVSAGRSASTTITLTPPDPPATTLPIFTNPTRVTNTYFPVATIRRHALRGTIGRESVRVERRLRDSRRDFTVGDKTVRTLILEDRTYVSDDLEEVALSYLAQADDGGVYLFGVNVSTYNDGRVVGREGSWLYGVDTDQLGILIPVKPEIGMAFQGEKVPGITEKESEVISMSETVRTSSGTFRNCLKIMDVYSEGAIEYRYYAPGVGLVKEVFANGELNLISRTSSRSRDDDDDDREDD